MDVQIYEPWRKSKSVMFSEVTFRHSLNCTSEVFAFDLLIT